ncbi:hypothetical protein ACFOD9_01545 [Novosphingobium bradum]|uniref:DUF4129 domain-containing protein n=1 Tax=Novosphingobium bradum TaxID=1737444 RepID=A0ABV7ILR0_9SPHN
MEAAAIEQSLSGEQGASGAGSAPGSDWAGDWQAVRDAADIQYAPMAPSPPPPTPDWLKRLGEWLEALLAPLGRWLGLSWPVFEKVLGLLGLIALVALGWVLARRWLAARRARPPRPAPAWTPDREEALALLDDADRLAAAGDHAGAVHLLLKRSVGQIAAARPDWIAPASTAREIAALERLAPRARTAFVRIAERVERSRFALRALSADDWREARAAYADFALASIEAPNPA